MPLTCDDLEVEELFTRPGLRQASTDEMVSFLIKRGFMAESSVTLTWDEKKHIVPRSPEAALWWWRKLVKVLNAGMCFAPGPKDYRKRWGHSYFSYIVGVEYQGNGNIHLHAVVDNWIDYELVHTWWEKFCGFAWIRKCDDARKATTYALKYALKKGATDCDVAIFLQAHRQTLHIFHSQLFEKTFATLPAPLPGEPGPVNPLSEGRHPARIHAAPSGGDPRG